MKGYLQNYHTYPLTTRCGNNLGRMRLDAQNSPESPQDKAGDRLKTSMETLAEMLVVYVVPIYGGPQNRPVHVGSGFFVRVLNDFYLVTAAHVLDDHASGLFYYVRPNLVRNISGTTLLTPAPEGRDNDLIDLGVVWLSEPPHPPYREVMKVPLEVFHFDLGDRPREQCLYALAGFPSTKNQANRAVEEFHASPYVHYLRRASDSQYSDFGVGDNNHLVLHLDRDKSDQPGTRLPLPRGMSGGPIWRVADLEGVVESGRPLVSGVFTRYRERTRSALATDVRHALRMIGELRVLTRR